MESEGNTWYFGKLPLVTVVSEIPVFLFLVFKQCAKFTTGTIWTSRDLGN